METFAIQIAIYFLVFSMLALLCLKLAEMLKCIRWVISVSEVFSSELHFSLGSSNEPDPVKILKLYGFPFFPGNVAVTKWATRLSDSFLVRGRLGSAFSVILFRYPNLIIICSFLALLPIGSHIRCLLTLILIFGVWVKACHLVIYRYKFGSLDNLLQSLSIPRMSASLNLAALELRGVRNFIRIFASTLISSIIAYAAAYYNFAKGAVPGNSLDGVQYDQPISVQALYFSTSTFCTVGYGDILARGWLVQVTAVTEMILSVTLLILFVTAFSSTAVLSKRSD